MDDSWGDTLTRSSIFVLSNEFFFVGVGYYFAGHQSLMKMRGIFG